MTIAADTWLRIGRRHAFAAVLPVPANDCDAAYWASLHAALERT